MAEDAGDSASGIRRYHDPRLLLDVAILLPGYIYITTHLEYVSTVLGTCIGVCLYDVERCFGGMNHFLLPAAHSTGRVTSANRHRYGSHAMADLLAGMHARGARRESLRAKVFGGARVNGDRHQIGRQNRDCAVRFLHAHGIEVVVEHTGGHHARQVLFDPRCGHARMRNAGAGVVPDGDPQETAYIQHALEPASLRRNLPPAGGAEE